MISSKLETVGWDPSWVTESGLHVSNIGTKERVLTEAIEFGGAVGADSVWLTSGTVGSRTWEEAADDFCTRIAPAVSRARDVGIALAIEPTNSLRTDISFVFSLRDSLVLARASGMGVVLELFCCWYERDLADQVSKNVHMLSLVQIADHKIGTRDTPNRSVIGDGDIPLERLIAMLLDAGYEGMFDLELIGPRIEAEGYLSATRRSLERASEMLDRLGA
jgi:sugar phosphate isomerase/epimerase